MMEKNKQKTTKESIEYGRRGELIAKECKIIRYGNYTEDKDSNIKPIKTITESLFYQMYLELNNVIRWKKVNDELIDMRISEAPVELMAHIMSKDLDYTLIYRNKNNKLNELGDELNRTSNSIYASVARLRKAGYLVKNEDDLFVPNDELKFVMKKTKEAFKKDGFFAFDFLFKFCVK